MGGSSSPCASCKLLRRRCAKECIFAPFFPSDDPHKFAIVHKVFGASNVSKMLQEIPFQQRADAVSSLVYEANARLRDPVYGCVGAISYLQNQVSQLQMQLAVAQAEILCVQMQPQQQQQQNGPHLQSLKNVDDHNDIHLDNMNHFDDKSFFNLHEYDLHSNSSNSSSITQLMDFASSTNVVQEPHSKRESLWA